MVRKNTKKALRTSGEPFFHRAIMLPNLDLVGRVHQHALLAEGFADGVVILHHQPQFRTGESLADAHVERRDESRESGRSLGHRA